MLKCFSLSATTIRERTFEIMNAFRDFVRRHQSTFESLTEGLKLMCDAKLPNANAKHVRSALGSIMDRCHFNIAPTASESKKSTTEAVNLRNEGNVAFGAERNEEALECYTKSIAFAPDRSEELALAFGNRSAVLYRLQKYELCVLDVNRALNGRFPDRLKQKLLERRKQCLTLIQEVNKIKSMFIEVSMIHFKFLSCKPRC